MINILHIIRAKQSVFRVQSPTKDCMIYTGPVTPDQRLLGHICFYIILTAPDRPDRGLVLNTDDDVISKKKNIYEFE